MPVVLAAAELETRLPQAEVSGVIGLGEFIASQTPGMTAGRRVMLREFLQRLQTAALAAQTLDSRLELSAADRTLLEFLWAQVIIRGRLPVRVRHVCDTCATETISNPDYDRLRQRNSKRARLSGLGMVLGPAGLNPFFLIGSLLRLRSVDPDFVCPRCKGMESLDLPMTFCPQCKSARAESVLLSCPDCGHDFGTEFAETISWARPSIGSSTAAPAAGAGAERPSTTPQPVDSIQRPRVVLVTRAQFKVARKCTALSASLDGRWLAAVGVYDEIKIFDLARSPEPIFRIPAPRKGFGKLSFDHVTLSADGSRVAAVSSSFAVSGRLPERTAQVWELAASPVLIRSLSVSSFAEAPALSGDGRRLAAGMTVLDVDTAEPLLTHPMVIDPAAFSRDGHLLASKVGRHAKTPIIITDFDSGQPGASIAPDDAAWVVGLGFDGSGQHLVIVLSDLGSHAVRVHDVSTGTEISRRIAPSRATAAAFSPDGTHLAVGTKGKMVRIWEIASTEDAYPVLTNPLPVSALAFLGQRTLTIGSNDGGVRVYDW